MVFRRQRGRVVGLRKGRRQLAESCLAGGWIEGECVGFVRHARECWRVVSGPVRSGITTRPVHRKTRLDQLPATQRVVRGGSGCGTTRGAAAPQCAINTDPAAAPTLSAFVSCWSCRRPKRRRRRFAVAPFTDADVQRIAALPAAEQVEEVRKELIRRNPGFDGKMETKIEDGVVTEFRIVTDQVTDIAPIRVFNALRVLDCSGTWTPTAQPNGLLADLTPLEGMNLAALTHLDLSDTKVSDAGLAYFKDCKNLTVPGPGQHAGERRGPGLLQGLQEPDEPLAGRHAGERRGPGPLQGLQEPDELLPGRHAGERRGPGPLQGLQEPDVSSSCTTRR